MMSRGIDVMKPPPAAMSAPGASSRAMPTMCLMER